MELCGLPDGPIVCNSVLMTSGGELHRALRRFGNEEKELRIWVDPLCSNQEEGYRGGHESDLLVVL